MAKKPTNRKPAAAKAVNASPAKGAVRKTVRDNKEKTTVSDETETINEGNVLTVGPTAKVTVSSSFKKNLGDYQSAEVFVSLTRPCEDTEEAIEETYTSVSEWVAAKVEAEVEAFGEAEEAEADDEEDLGDEEAAEEDGEADEDTEGEGEEEEDGIDPDYINSLNRKDLEAFVTENELETDPSEFPKNAKGLKGFREAVIAEVFAEEDEDADAEEAEEAEDADAEEEGEEAEDEEAGDEEAEEDGDEEGEGYTEDELKAMKLAEVREVIEAWEINVKVPKGTKPPQEKAKLIKAILDYQENPEG